METPDRALQARLEQLIGSLIVQVNALQLKNELLQAELLTLKPKPPKPKE